MPKKVFRISPILFYSIKTDQFETDGFAHLRQEATFSASVRWTILVYSYILRTRWRQRTICARKQKLSSFLISGVSHRGPRKREKQNDKTVKGKHGISLLDS